MEEFITSTPFRLYWCSPASRGITYAYNAEIGHPQIGFSPLVNAILECALGHFELLQ